MTARKTATLEISLNGYTDLPPGKIANVVTFLERAPPIEAPPRDPAVAIHRVRQPSLDWYRDLYRRIGEDWLWFSMALMPDARLAAILNAPGTVVLTFERDGRSAGLAELDFSKPGAVEIVMFGVVPEETGTGAAHALMNAALTESMRPDIERVWLHTCTFDHPAAVRFYRRQGFSAYKFAIEVSDDPRLSGRLRRDAAPHVPLIDPAARTPPAED